MIYYVKIKQKRDKPKDYSTSQESFALLLPDVFAHFYKTEKANLDILDMREVLTDQTADNKYCIAAATVGQTKTTFPYNTDEVLGKESSVNKALKAYVLASLKIPCIAPMKLFTHGETPSE